MSAVDTESNYSQCPVAMKANKLDNGAQVVIFVEFVRRRIENFATKERLQRLLVGWLLLKQHKNTSGQLQNCNHRQITYTVYVPLGQIFQLRLLLPTNMCAYTFWKRPENCLERPAEKCPHFPAKVNKKFLTLFRIAPRRRHRQPNFKQINAGLSSRTSLTRVLPASLNPFAVINSPIFPLQINNNNNNKTTNNILRTFFPLPGFIVGHGNRNRPWDICRPDSSTVPKDIRINKLQ